MIWARSSGAGGHCLACRGFSTCVFSTWLWVTIKKLSFGLAVVFLVGLVRAAPMELSTSACVLCTVVVCPVSYQMSSLALPLWRGCGVDHQEVVVVPWHLLFSPTGLVVTEVPVVTVIPVATAFGIAFLSCPGGRVLVAVWAAVAIRVCITMPRPVAFWGTKAKSLGWHPFPLFWHFSFLLLPKEEKFPLSSSGGSGLAERQRLMRSGGTSCGVRRRRPWRLSRAVPCALALADDPSGGCSQKGCRACLCPLGLSQRLVSCRSGLCALLLAACGGGLVVLAVTLFHMLFPRLCSRCQVLTPDCCFYNPFLGAVCGGTGGRACSETLLLTWLLGVSRGDTWLFLPDLMEVWDVSAGVVRLWSHVVAPVFRELLHLDEFVFGLTWVVVEFLLLWLIRGLRHDLRGSLAGVQE
ncbi:hypothetical protein Taro_054196, partial [Colocasia esculenta]|nr:hypothetical protein [Colocasia esculenta]